MLRTTRSGPRVLLPRVRRIRDPTAAATAIPAALALTATLTATPTIHTEVANIGSVACTFKSNTGNSVDNCTYSTDPSSLGKFLGGPADGCPSALSNTPRSQHYSTSAGPRCSRKC
ncbi:hypothetical protein B0H16DRAFT_1885689 [Mycena metata]|uniref:Uncharacterized protein n=1 Tax=Mycena metata TaxID=1033252 RepID=A0AAD7J6X2_9AGAR|nr:hypothetical protein B0H16DRAFT_1885689 [Mycena metata]